MNNAAKKREEKLMKGLRDFMKLKDNKKCADCTEKVPQAVLY